MSSPEDLKALQQVYEDYVLVFGRARARGLEAQMLMVAEEATELAHAVLKWRRAWKRYNKRGISLTRLEGDGALEETAYARALEKVTENVRVEAMQVLFMIDQLQVMQPADYETILETELQETRQLLIQRGAKL